MPSDQSFDESTRRQRRATAWAGVCEREPGRPIAAAAILEALVELGVGKRGHTRKIRTHHDPEASSGSNLGL